MKLKARYTGLIISLLLISLCFSGCSDETAETDKPAASQLTFLYTTDSHGRVISDESAIGMDTIAAIKKETPNSLLLDMGDFLHGLPTATLTQGKDVVELMKEAGYSAVAIGNHDFNYGQDILLNREAEAAKGDNQLTFLCSNVKTAGGDFFTNPTLITTVNDVKIGLFALITLDTKTLSAPSVLKGLSFENEIESAKAMIKKLESEGCDIIIAMSHVGTDTTTQIKSTDIADQVDGIDILIDGHSHVTLDKVSKKGTIIVSSGQYGEHLGKLTIEYNSEKDKVTVKENTLITKEDTANIIPDSAIAEKIAKIQQEQNEILSEKVASTFVDLVGEKKDIRTNSTNLGNLCADAHLMAVPDADIAIMNGGCIRETIKQGDVTKGDILAAVPYSNIIYTKKVTGAQLKEILEHAFSLLPEADGRFPQIGGFTVKVDADAEPGSRILSVILNDGSELDVDSTYLLSINDYLAEGGDDYPVLDSLPIEGIYTSVEEALITYLNSTDMEQYKTSEKRIQFQ